MRTSASGRRGALVVVLLAGATACRVPVRTVSSDVALSPQEWAVACSLYRSLRDVQGDAFERRVITALGDRMDRC